MPKSTTFTLPSKDTRMFCGETSRWTMSSGRPCSSLALVGVVQPRAGVGHDAQGERDRELAAARLGLLRDPAHVLAVDVLHGDEVRAALVAEVEDLRDVRVVQPRRDPGLVQEHLHELLVLGEVRQDPLHHQLLLEALEADLARQMDLGHPAHGELPDQLVLTEVFGGQGSEGAQSPRCDKPARSLENIGASAESSVGRPRGSVKLVDASGAGCLAVRPARSLPSR